MTIEHGRRMPIWIGEPEYRFVLHESIKHNISIAAVIRAMIVDCMAEDKENVQRSAAARRARSGEAAKGNGATTP